MDRLRRMACMPPGRVEGPYGMLAVAGVGSVQELGALLVHAIAHRVPVVPTLSARVLTSLLMHEGMATRAHLLRALGLAEVLVKVLRECPMVSARLYFMHIVGIMLSPPNGPGTCGQHKGKAAAAQQLELQLATEFADRFVRAGGCAVLATQFAYSVSEVARWGGLARSKSRENSLGSPAALATPRAFRVCNKQAR